MKMFFRYTVPCMVLALVLSGCNDLMDDKAVIDAKNEILDNPTIAMVSAEAATYETATVSGVVSDLENVQEFGFQLSADETFANSTNYISEDVTAEFAAELTGLSEQTTYYVRAYVFTKTGHTVYSETTTFTTPSAPFFDIDGYYIAVDYEHTDPTSYTQSGASYYMSIQFVEGSETEVEIYNLWGGNEMMMGVYDAATSTITVPTGQNLYYYDGYGYVIANAVNDAMTSFQDAIIFKFTSLGGLMETGIYRAYLPAASHSFGFLHTSMKRVEDPVR